MTAHRRRSLALVLLAASGAAAAADECRLKFRVNNSASTFTETLNAGASRTLSRNGLIEALNEGRNDLVLTLENMGAQTSVALLRSGTLTLLLPPTTLFTGQKLQAVQCRTYATVLDSQQALSRFANPAQAVAQAAAVAQTQIEQAREQALSVYDPQKAVADMEDLLGAMTAIQQKMTQAGTVSRTHAPAPAPAPEPAATLAARFPELAAALEASDNLRAGVPAHVVADARTRSAALLEKLQALDRRYRVGAATPAVAVPTLAQHFPEVEALRTSACRVEPPPLPHFDVQARAFASDLRTRLAQRGPTSSQPLPADVRLRIGEVQESLSSVLSRPLPLAEFHRVGSRHGFSFPHVADTPTGLPYASVPVPFPSLPPDLGDAAVGKSTAGWEAQLGSPPSLALMPQMLAQQQMTAEAARADAAKVETHLRGSAADALALGRALAALAATIRQGAAQQQDDLRTLAGIADTIEALRAAVWTGVPAMAACTAQRAARFAAAAQTAPQRLQVFVATLAQAPVVNVPIPVRQALDTTLERVAAQGPRHATLAQRVAPLPATLAQLDAARLQVHAAAFPTPRPELPQRAQAYEQARQKLVAELVAAVQAVQTVSQGDAAVASGLAMLVARIQEPGGAIAADAAPLAWTATDLSGFAADQQRAQAVAGLWQQAITTLPTRLAAAAAPPPVSASAPNTAAAQELWEQLKRDVADAAQCRGTADAHRAAIAQPARVGTAVGQATSGLQSQLQAVVTTLQGLLPPSPATSSQVPVALQAAREANDRVQGVPVAGRQAFLDATASARSGMGQAWQCVKSRTQQAKGRIAQLQRLLP